MEFADPSPQLATVLAFLQAVTDQNPDVILAHLTEDCEYHWITPGFDALGPQVKNKAQTRAFFTAVGGTFVKDFKASLALRIPAQRLISISVQYIIQDYVEMPGKIVLQVCSLPKAFNRADFVSCVDDLHRRSAVRGGEIQQPIYVALSRRAAPGGGRDAQDQSRERILRLVVLRTSLGAAKDTSSRERGGDIYV